MIDSSNATPAKLPTSSDSDCGLTSDWSTRLATVATFESGAAGSSSRTTCRTDGATLSGSALLRTIRNREVPGLSGQYTVP